MVTGRQQGNEAIMHSDPKRRMPKASKSQQPSAAQPALQESFPQHQQYNYPPMQQFPRPMPSYMMPPMQPMMNLPTSMNQAPSSTLRTSQTLPSVQLAVSACRVTATQAEHHTRHLSSVIAVEKAFLVSCTIFKPDRRLKRKQHIYVLGIPSQDKITPSYFSYGRRKKEAL